MQAFLFDDNTIRIDWFLATALGFVKLRARLSAAPIIVTHDQTQARRLAERIVVIEDGRIGSQREPLPA